MRSIMIKGKWKSKDKILLMFLIGQVFCIVSFCKPLLPLSNDIMHCFSPYIATIVATACGTLMPSIILLLILVITTGAIVQHNYALIQQLYHCPKSGFSKTSFRLAADYFCFLSLFVFCWSCQSIAIFFAKVFVVWHHDKNNLVLRNLESSDKIAKVTCSSWAHVTWARWWSPGRAETIRRSGVRTSLNSFSSSSVWLFGHRRLSLHWSLAVSISCKGRCSVCASLWSLKLRFIVFYFICDHKMSWPMLHPCASSHPVPLSLAGYFAILSIAGFMRTQGVACRFFACR